MRPYIGKHENKNVDAAVIAESLVRAVNEPELKAIEIPISDTKTLKMRTLKMRTTKTKMRRMPALLSIRNV